MVLTSHDTNAVNFLNISIPEGRDEMPDQLSRDAPDARTCVWENRIICESMCKSVYVLGVCSYVAVRIAIS